MDISTNGDRVVANEGNAIKLWDLNTTGFRDVPVLSPKSTFVFHKRSVSALSLFEDSFVAGADLGGEVSLVDIRKEQLVAKFKSVSLFTLLSSTAAYCSRNSTLQVIVGVFICFLNYFFQAKLAFIFSVSSVTSSVSLNHLIFHYTLLLLVNTSTTSQPTFKASQIHHHTNLWVKTAAHHSAPHRLSPHCAAARRACVVCECVRRSHRRRGKQRRTLPFFGVATASSPRACRESRRCFRDRVPPQREICFQRRRRRDDANVGHRGSKVCACVSNGRKRINAGSRRYWEILGSRKYHYLKTQF